MNKPKPKVKARAVAVAPKKAPPVPSKRPAPPDSMAVTRRPTVVPDSLFAYGEDEGMGFETMTREDFAIPFLVVLQPLSPQVAKGPDRIEGAEAGSIYNTVTQEVSPGEEGVVVVPVHRTHNFIEWVPRDNGGGLVSIYGPEDEMVVEARRAQRFGKIALDNGNDLVETFSVFALRVKEDGSSEQVIMNFSSTQIKAYRTWMTRAGSVSLRTSDGRTVRPPLFAHRYRLTTRFDSNDKGSWYSWVVGFDGENADEARLAVDDQLYLDARAFRGIAASEDQRALRTSTAASGARVQGTDTPPSEEEDM